MINQEETINLIKEEDKKIIEIDRFMDKIKIGLKDKKVLRKKIKELIDLNIEIEQGCNI